MATFTESFDAPNAALQSAACDLTWAYVIGSSNGWAIVSNQATPNGASRGITNYDRAQHDTDTSDQYGQFVVHAIVPGTDCQGGPCVRFQADANTSYMAAVNAGDGSPTVTIIKTVAGTRTSIGSPVSVDITGLPKVLRIEVSGSTLTAYWNGVQVAQETDTAIPTGTRGGLYGHEDSGQGLGFIVDDFEFGDLGGASENHSGGSTATVTATASGAGSSHRSGGSTATATAVVSGAGSKGSSGSSEATVTATATGSGTSSRAGGADATVTVTASGAGASGRAGGGQPTVTVTATGGGAGEIPPEGGSTASVAVTVTGGGVPGRSGGATAGVVVTVTGGGFEGEPPDIPTAIRVVVPADLIRATVEADQIRATVPASRIRVEVPE